MPVDLPPPAAPAAAAPVLAALRRVGSRDELVRVDPRRLTVLARPIRLGRTTTSARAVATAPDGRTVAVATASGVRDTNRIRFVRVAGWTRTGTVTLPRSSGAVVRLVWLRRDRVLAFSRARGGTLRLTVLDSRRARQVGERRDLPGSGAPRAVGRRVALLSTLDTAVGADTSPARASVLLLSGGGTEIGRVPLGDLSGPAVAGDRAPAPPPPTYATSGDHLLALSGSAPLLVDVDVARATATPRPFTAPTPLIRRFIDDGPLAFALADPATGRTSVVPLDRRTLTPGTPAPLPGTAPPAGGERYVLSWGDLDGLRAVRTDGTTAWAARRGDRITEAVTIGRYVYATGFGDTDGSTVHDARTGSTVAVAPGRALRVLDPTDPPREDASPSVFVDEN